MATGVGIGHGLHMRLSDVADIDDHLVKAGSGRKAAIEHAGQKRDGGARIVVEQGAEDGAGIDGRRGRFGGRRASMMDQAACSARVLDSV